MAVRRRDRSHFELIGEEMRAEKEEQRRETLVGSLADRIETGLLLGAFPRDAATEEALDRRADEQIELARKRPS